MIIDAQGFGLRDPKRLSFQRRDVSIETPETERFDDILMRRFQADGCRTAKLTHLSAAHLPYGRSFNPIAQVWGLHPATKGEQQFFHTSRLHTLFKRTFIMDRRQFATVGLSAIALSAVGSGLQAQDKKEHPEHDDMLMSCGKACSDCQRLCDMCATHCSHLLATGKKEHAATLATCQDCGDYCAAAARIVSRGGPFASLVCEGCAEACGKCAKQCEQFPDDKHMKMCAEECRRCEKACREMAKHAGHSR